MAALDGYLREVAERSEASRQFTSLLAASEAERDTSIHLAAEAGVSVREIVRESGLSRARVYQILDKQSQL